MQIVTKESVGGNVELGTGQWGSRLFYPGSGEGGEARFCFVPGPSHGSQTLLSHTHGSAALRN